MPDLIHTLPAPDDLALAEIAQKHTADEADELVWREHMAKLKLYAGR